MVVKTEGIVKEIFDTTYSKAVRTEQQGVNRVAHLVIHSPIYLI
jgi:hypothetical protein